MTNSLARNYSQEEKTKKQLQKAIHRRKEILESLMAKVEELSLELELVKHEYHVRIGSLILKDNQLDLEILKLKNLKDLVSQGMSYGEAIKHEEDAFYNEILRMQKEQEEIKEEKEILEKRYEVSESVEEQVKNIWKVLIRKYHPDLVSDEEEKSLREKIMKQINRAYAENDLETLQKFENNMQVEDVVESSIEKLEKILIDTENMILQAKLEYKELRLSEWFGWKKRMEKARKEKVDIFKELENDLLDDITKKIVLLQHLRKDVGDRPVV